MSLFKNPQVATFASTFPTDNVLNVYTGSLVIPIRTDPINTVVFNTGVTGSIFWRGIFTINGGTNYNDVGGREFFDDGAGDLTEYGVDASSSSGNLTIASVTNDGTNTYTCNFQIATIVKPQQGEYDTTNVNLPVINQYLQVKNNYRKIFQDNVTAFTITSGATSSNTFLHSLGYRPSVECFVEVSGVLYDATAYRQIIFTSGFTTCMPEVRVSTSDVTVFFINDTGSSINTTIYCRIYYDAA